MPFLAPTAVPWMGNALGLAGLGTGLYSMFNQPDVGRTDQRPATFLGEGYSTIFDPVTNTTKQIKNWTPEQYGKSALYDLYYNRLMGGQTSDDWNTATGDRVTELQRLMDPYENAPSAMTRGEWNKLHPNEANPTHSIAYSQAALQQTAAYQNYLEGLVPTGKTPEYDEWKDELTALQGMLKNPIDIPFTQYGKEPGKERQFQIGEETGAYKDLMQRSIDKSYTSALADLARRGITGGTAETEMWGRKAESEADVTAQATQFADNLRRYDDEQKMQLLNFIAGGQSADAARSFQEQSLSQSGLYGQQQLQAAQQQFAYQQEMQRQASANNMAMMLGQAGGSWSQQGQQQKFQQTIMDLLNRMYPAGT